MRLSKVLGFFMIVSAPILAILYTMWIFGLVSWLDPELAVKLTVYVLVMVILGVMGLLGYILATAPAPVIARGDGSG